MFDVIAANNDTRRVVLASGIELFVFVGLVQRIQRPGTTSWCQLLRTFVVIDLILASQRLVAVLSDPIEVELRPDDKACSPMATASVAVARERLPTAVAVIAVASESSPIATERSPEASVK